MESSFVMMAGVLLIIPGFFTDLIGLLFLIPKLRSRLFKLLIRIKVIKTPPTTAKQQPKNVIIDGECWQEPEDRSQKTEDENSKNT